MNETDSPAEDGGAAAGIELESFLPYRLSLLTNTVSDGIARSYRDRHEISVTEWRVMAVLGRFPGLSASAVVERTAMDKVAISRSVSRLEERDLLLRQVAEADRRRSELWLSEQGEAVYAEIVPLARDFEKRLLEGLDDRQCKVMDKLLVTLQAAAENLPGGQPR